MKTASSTLLILLFLSLLVTAQETPKLDTRYYRQEAFKAYRSRDYEQALRNFEKGLVLVPDYPAFIYNSASMSALLNRRQEAVSYLNRLADMHLVFRPENDETFASLKDSPEFKAILTRFDENRRPIVRSTRSFSLTERGLITEGIAYDPIKRNFYISSVHKRKILAVDRWRKARDFAAEGLWGVLGMKVDARRRHLWVTTTAFPQVQGFKNEDEGKSAIVKFELDNGKLIKRYDLPAGRHALGDLVINKNGDVFATDSLSPAIYVVRQASERVETLIEGAPFISPQGLAFNDDEKVLFVADYPGGVFEVDPVKKSAKRLIAPANSTTLGIDGLYYYRGSLIAIQNGISPHRVIRMRLASGSTIKEIDILESSNPVFDEPTLGVVVGDSFHFIANSQWESVNDKGEIVSPGKLKDPVVLELKLNK